MPPERAIPLPEPGLLRAGEPPYLRDSATGSPAGAFVPAAALALGAGTILFGWHALRVAAICVVAAILVDWLFHTAAGRSRPRGTGPSLLIGLLTACTMPADVFWTVPLCAVVVALLVGHLGSGGVGNYIWHPVALGRVAVELLFPLQMNPPRWPVLGPGHLLRGNLDAGWSLPPLGSWSDPLPEHAQAWLVPSSADVLRHVVEPAAASGSSEGLTPIIRDVLPPWWSVLTGVAGGPIGEACLLAILAAGLLLVWRGWLRWPLPVAAALAAAVTAAVLPVTGRPHGPAQWLPILQVQHGLPVGLMYVIYQVTAGELPWVATVLAADPTSSPLTTRGHAIFGVFIGAAAIALRVGLGLPAAGYWALLAANVLVPLIDRITRRRVFGT